MYVFWSKSDQNRDFYQCRWRRFRSDLTWFNRVGFCVFQSHQNPWVCVKMSWFSAFQPFSLWSSDIAVSNVPLGGCLFGKGSPKMCAVCWKMRESSLSCVICVISNPRETPRESCITKLVLSEKVSILVETVWFSHYFAQKQSKSISSPWFQGRLNRFNRFSLCLGGTTWFPIETKLPVVFKIIWLCGIFEENVLESVERDSGVSDIRDA